MIVYKIYLCGGKPWQPTTNNSTGVWCDGKSAVVMETSDQGHDIEISFPGVNRTLRIHSIKLII